KIVCKFIKKKNPKANTVLDVGCSVGLFLKIAEAEGFSVTGLEPDANLAVKLKEQGYQVINGFFPGAEELSNKKYDAIIFNDSLEHIPELQGILQGLKDYLEKNGLVIINVPTSSGIIFKISSLLYKIGVKAPLERAWQKGFASPHVHYFNKDNLLSLFERNGFITQYTTSLSYYTIKGLWKRLSCKSSFIFSIFAWLCLVAMYPFYMLKSDSLMACFSISEELTNT
ncbi:MAG: class I SAM-dependent methyltransferase, partial [Fibromonadaceae bacterium]|nr:class I SAM-dependent methyltransferase [Fibromonadaceae bacterium]